MFAISFVGSGGLIAAAFLAFVLFSYFEWRRAAIWLAVTLAGALVLELTLKFAFHRPRPVPFLAQFLALTAFPADILCFRSVSTECWPDCWRDDPCLRGSWSGWSLHRWS
jgi:hypothetical protein